MKKDVKNKNVSSNSGTSLCRHIFFKMYDFSFEILSPLVELNLVERPLKRLSPGEPGSFCLHTKEW